MSKLTVIILSLIYKTNLVICSKERYLQIVLLRWVFKIEVVYSRLIEIKNQV